MLRSPGRRAVTTENTVFVLTSNGVVENKSNVRVSGLSLTPAHLILALLVVFNKYHRQRPHFARRKILDETLGKLFLLNIFDQKPDQQNLIGVSLPRMDDLEGSADASFFVNEVDQDYADVVFASAIPLFPGNNGRCSRTCHVPDMLVRKSIEHVGGGRSESATLIRDRCDAIDFP
ncbi:hypothetical protein B0H14DRAFT_3620332 [Mycena olivaceomarginata]|nr:hypothetical protein B0H14DRAFT_3620332 [Mycena olivaceomarginata]